MLDIKYIKEFAAKKGLSKKQTQELIEAEILSARYSYLKGRNQENERSGSYEAVRDTNANNREMDVLSREYTNRERSLGNIKGEAAAYVAQQRNKENQNQRGASK